MFFVWYEVSARTPRKVKTALVGWVVPAAPIMRLRDPARANPNIHEFHHARKIRMCGVGFRPHFVTSFRKRPGGRNPTYRTIGVRSRKKRRPTQARISVAAKPECASPEEESRSARCECPGSRPSRRGEILPNLLDVIPDQRWLYSQLRPGTHSVGNAPQVEVLPTNPYESHCHFRHP